ncbi:ABC transporter B family member 1-like [Anneissia japonica]|uniref:ABC transporter B family member 1-like n=1 Tax=Anneissia japonica TaxID=1529436 RepID=UPI0014256ABB|nr:ABC transporter B family member 1-like [Anneissia japonica]
MVHSYFVLPGIRFINITRSYIIVAGLASVILWITGGHDVYLEQTVTKWGITTSAFELACIAFIKVFILFYLYTKVEDFTLRILNDPYNLYLESRKRLCHIFIFIVSFICFGYASVKGGLVLNAILNDASYTPMHPTYNALVIASIVFGFIDVSLSIISPYYLRKLQVIRVQKRFNDDLQEIDENGKVIMKEKSVSLTRMLSLAKPEAGLLFIGMIALVFSSASSMAAPLFFGKVIDAAAVHQDMARVNKAVLILFLISAGGAVASFFRSWVFTLAGTRVVCRVRRNLLAAIIQQDIAFFDLNRTGELTSRLSSDTQVVQNAITVNISMLVRYMFQILGSLVIMLVQSPSLTGVLLSVVPIVAIGAVQYGKFVKGISKKFQDALGDASTVAEESISSIRTVRSFTSERKALKLYSKEIEISYGYGKQIALASGIANGIIGIVAQGAITLVLWYGGKLVYNSQISVGILTAFMLYTLNVAMAFAFLSSLYGDFMKAVGASIRVFDLMDRVPEIRNSGGNSLLDFDGSIDFLDVNFTYPSRPETQVLKGVTFGVKPGQMVALVGPSGGGKSTIVSLIERFYEPNSGTIHLGGTDLKTLDPQWFRKQIGMVSQEPVLFACSIKENIAYGKDADDEEIIEAAKQANAHDFITSFEEGYDTKVGERGVRLSGGQKQRVAIARALILNPSVLLLDEATSALDAESEFLVQEAIDRAMQNRTVLVIAHRLSTVRNASQVVVIKDGAVAEMGTHDELLVKGGVYKDLVLRQLSSGTEKEAVKESSINGDLD